MWAAHDKRKSAGEFDAAQAVEQETGADESEGGSEPVVPPDPLLTGILWTAMCVGVYELAGGLGRALYALAAGNALPLGTHLWLSRVGWVFLGIGGLCLLMFLARW